MIIVTFKILRYMCKKEVKEVAENLKIAENTYRSYECSARLPSADMLFKMADIYGCELGTIRQAFEYHCRENARKKSHTKRVKKQSNKNFCRA